MQNSAFRSELTTNPQGYSNMGGVPAPSTSRARSLHAIPAAAERIQGSKCRPKNSQHPGPSKARTPIEFEWHDCWLR